MAHKKSEDDDPYRVQSSAAGTGGMADLSAVDHLVRYRVVGLLTLAAALSYLIRNAVSVAESTIRVDMNFSLAQSAWLMGAFFWSYALCQVPAGWWSQQLGSRATLPIYAVAWSTAAVLLGCAQSFWLLIAAQLVMGVAQAGIFPAACNSIAHWMPLTRRSLACAILASGMQIGAIVASLITGRLLEPLSWRGVFMVYAIPGFAWAVWFWWRFRDQPQADPRVTATELAIIQGTPQPSGELAAADAPNDPPVQERVELTSPDQPAEQPAQKLNQPSSNRAPTPWAKILVHSTIWFLCMQQIARAAGYMFFASWFPTFLQKTRDVSIGQSGVLQSVVLSGTLIGSLCGGLITDWIFARSGNLRTSRSGVGMAALAACGLLILASWFVEDVRLAVCLMAVGSICAALAGPCAFSTTIDVGGVYTPQVFGLMNMVGNLAAAFCPVAVAMLFSWTENWNLVLLLFAALYMLGACSWLLIDPRKRL